MDLHHEPLGASAAAAAAARLPLLPFVLGVPFSRAANFDFARYACLVTDRQILSMANISLSSWVALLVFRWVWYGLQKAISSNV